MRARVRFIRARACVSACIQPEGRNGSCTPMVTREAHQEPSSVPSGIFFFFPTVFGSKRVPNFRYSRRISWRIRLAGCRLCAAHRSVEFGECARALWTQRAEGSKAAEGRPMQRFLSALGSILQTLHWTKSMKVQCPKQHKSKARAKPSRRRLILPM